MTIQWLDITGGRGCPHLVSINNLTRAATASGSSQNLLHDGPATALLVSDLDTVATSYNNIVHDGASHGFYLAPPRLVGGSSIRFSTTRWASPRAGSTSRRLQEHARRELERRYSATTSATTGATAGFGPASTSPAASTPPAATTWPSPWTRQGSPTARRGRRAALPDIVFTAGQRDFHLASGSARRRPGRRPERR